MLRKFLLFLAGCPELTKVPDKYLPQDEERIRSKPYSQEEIKCMADCITAYQPNIAQ